jgi:hypothetical protein
MRWHTADFDTMSWHDAHVHGWRVIEGEAGVADIALDLDFVLEWIGPEDGRYRFRVVQTMLQFHDVIGLRLALDYAVCSAGTSPFSIERIMREPLQPTRTAADDEQPDGLDDYGPWRWRIEVNWPEGFIEFAARGFTQWAVGDAIEQDAQSLSPALRI